MNVLIVGYGRVGIRTADILRSEGHRVTVVDNDPEKVERARDAGFEAYEGDGDDDDVLEGAGVGAADALGALTGDLTVNLSACVVGGAYDCRTVLRIDDDYRAEIYRKYTAEVDEVVYPERLGAAGAKTALLGGDFDALGELTESLSAVSVTIGADADVVGRRVVDVDLPEGARVYAHGRRGESMTIPLPQTEIRAGDEVAFIAEPERVAEVRALLGGA
jgi:trk system potassium uptake protein TrkA